MKDYDFHIEKIYNLVSILRTELSAHEENCDKKILFLKNKLDKIIAENECNNMSTNEIMNELFSDIESRFHNIAMLNKGYNEAFQKRLEYLEREINIINFMLIGINNHLGLSKDEPQ